MVYTQAFGATYRVTECLILKGNSVLWVCLVLVSFIITFYETDLERYVKFSVKRHRSFLRI